MQKIEIVKGEEFKITVKEEIQKEDIFIREYERAAVMLNEIVGSSLTNHTARNEWSWKQQDFENNIIAFCGERGEGKSSAMMTFVNAVYEKDKNKAFFSAYSNLNQVYFEEPILIDPSMFDDVHNVLDIVLAKIYRKFSEYYERDNQCTDERTKDRLVDQFQKVYRYVSLINNQKQMLDDEFDYEGNISKLSKLGNSTKLKEELSKLVKEYLEFKAKNQNKEVPQMIIAIDDLDLCSSNAYKMAEQIRKYLVIPNVSIVISVKIDQLELCIRERNLRDFEKTYQSRLDDVYGHLNQEVQTMAERYVAKLIPRQRRIYLPQIQDLDEVKIVYKGTDGGEHVIGMLEEKPEVIGSFTQAMLDLIYARTGMLFRPEKSGISYLFPNNLRDMISWIITIVEMKKPDKQEEEKTYFENILIFKRFFERERSGNDLKFYDGLTLQDLGNMDAYHLHIAVRRILEKIYIDSYPSELIRTNNYVSDCKDSFFSVMELFENCEKDIVDIEKEAFIYRLRALYTIKLNGLLKSGQTSQMVNFLNKYIWGPKFSGVLPVHYESKLDRSRFVVGAIEGYNRILDEFSYLCVKLDNPELGKAYHVPYIPEEDEREDYIKAWIVLGLLSNVYDKVNNQIVYSTKGTIIYDNSIMYDYVQISLENYLVGLCDLSMIYDKVNMARLGIDREEFDRIVKELEVKNKESIQYAREIVSNIDIILGIKQYCTEHREYKERTQYEGERSKKLVEKFFRNVREFMGQYGIKSDSSAFQSFWVKEKVNGIEEPIDIGTLYADLFELSIQNEPIRKQMEEDRKVDEYVLEFWKKLTEIPTEWDPEFFESVHISQSMRNLSADNTKNNLDKLAFAVQQYNARNKSLPKSLEVEGLCNLYGDVVRLYLKNKNTQISREQHEEYKRLVKVQNEINTID